MCHAPPTTFGPGGPGGPRPGPGGPCSSGPPRGRSGRRVRHGSTVIDGQWTVIASSPVTSPLPRPGPVRSRSGPDLVPVPVPVSRSSPGLSGRGGSLGSECGRHARRVAAAAGSGVHLSPPSDEWPIRAAISKPALY